MHSKSSVRHSAGRAASAGKWVDGGGRVACVQRCVRRHVTHRLIDTTASQCQLVYVSRVVVVCWRVRRLVCVCTCVRAYARASVYVCVCTRTRARRCVSECPHDVRPLCHTSLNVYVTVCVCVCVCVCLGASLCVPTRH